MLSGMDNDTDDDCLCKSLLKIVRGAFAPRCHRTLRVMAGTTGVNLFQPTNGHCKIIQRFHRQEVRTTITLQM